MGTAWLGAPSTPNMATRSPSTPAAPETAPAAGLGSYFTQRPNGALGAAVPQLNGVVMSPTNGVGYAAYTGGETVNLGAVNSSAFGTPGFRP